MRGYSANNPADWRRVRTLACLLTGNLLLAACATGGTINGGPAPSLVKVPTFYASSTPSPVNLSVQEATALASAEKKALEYGQPKAAYSWKAGKNVSGTVQASEPFRIARRDCRRLNYSRSATNGGPSRTQVTVCRSSGNPWEPVV